MVQCFTRIRAIAQCIFTFLLFFFSYTSVQGQPVYYDTDMNTLFSDGGFSACITCHFPGSFFSPYDMTTYAATLNSAAGFCDPQVIPFDSENSAIYDKVANANPSCGFSQMPLGGPFWNQTQLDLLAAWIDGGALENANSNCADLMISAYVEGSSNNKYIEIYNGTGATVDLSNYTLDRYTNGSMTVSGSFTLSGMLNDGDYLLVANGSANLPGLTPDLTSGVLSFNGDDAMALRNTLLGLNVDVVGEIGNDPGSEWTGAVCTTGTQNGTLVKKNFGATCPYVNFTGNSDFNIAIDDIYDCFGEDDVTMLNTYAPPATEVFFSVVNASVNETDVSYDICLSILNPDAANATMAELALISGDASFIDNYTTQSVTFPANDGNDQCVTITLTDNGDCDETQDFEFEIQNAAGGLMAFVGMPSQFTLTIVDDELVMMTEFLQGFEGSMADNWNFTETPATYNEAGGSDVWAVIGSLGGITPASGGMFWGMEDLNNTNGGGNFDHILDFEDVSVAGLGNAVLSFDYNVIGYDSGDDFKYEVFFDGVGQGEVLLVDGNSNFTTNDWETETILIPNGTMTVGLEIRVIQNGPDNGGIDNVTIKTEGCPCLFTLAETHVDASCSGAADGSIDLEIIGGLGPFSISWSTMNGLGLSPMDEDQSGLTAGNYMVVVTEAGTNCMQMLDVTIGELIYQSPNSINPITACEDETIVIEPLGGGQSVVNFASDLFISEYIEGSSNNKCVEIFNGTGADVDLSTYAIEIYANGNNSANSTIALSGILADGDVYVLCNTNAAANFLAVADQTSGAVSFNGDDAVVLANNSNPVDIFGNIGCDPGSEWNEGGNDTQNQTLVRNADVFGGVSTNPGGDCPFPTLSTEWQTQGNDNDSDLGQHSYDQVVNAPPAYNFYDADPNSGGTLLGSGATYTVNVPADIPADGMPNSIFVTAADLGQGCESDPIEVQITVNALPTANPTAASPGTCLGGSVTIDGMPAGGSGIFQTHTWVITGGTATGVSLTNDDAQVVTVDATTATEGTVDLDYVVEDDNGCLSIASSITIEIVDCDVSITDPCVCLNNATTLDNGQFSETIEVTAPTGQTWTVISVNGLYDISSPNPPGAPVGIPVGTVLVETPAGSGNYELEGIHVDALGYSMIVENELNQQLTVSNTCYYPNPVITNLDDPICLFTPIIPLTFDANGVTGTGTFTINGNPAMELDPMALGIGTHTVELSFDAGDALGYLIVDGLVVGAPNFANTLAEAEADPGCTQSVSMTIEIVETPSQIACNQNLQISLDDLCEANLSPDMILEGNYLCFDDYSISVANGPFPVPNPVTGDYIGDNLTVTVTHLPSGNSCWGNLVVEDKLPPTLTCNDITIECYQNPDLVPNPVATDNCTANPIEVLADEVIDDSNICGGVTITQTWLAFDNMDNESNPCMRTIFINPGQTPDLPVDVTWTCSEYEEYPNITDPTAYTGFLPSTGSGIPENIDGLYCNYAYSYHDDTLSTCGNTFKIVRTWTVLNWCTGQLVFIDNNGNDNIQVIKIIDDTAPTINQVSFTISANINGNHPEPCRSTGFLPAAEVSDECNGYTLRIYTPVGEAEYSNGVNGNNGGNVPLPGLELGDHIITYVAEDECGNVSELEVTITVIDNIAPVVVCDEVTSVTLSSDGLAVVNAETFDDGSHDNCCLDHFEVARMSNSCSISGNTIFGENITFCCEDVDAGPQLVVFRAVDCFNNYNDCMVQVIVEDKIDPILTSCPTNQSMTCDFYWENFEAAISLGDNSVLNIYGEADFIDNCEFTTTHNVTPNIDQCGGGTIVRTWIAEDPSGNTSSTCTQTLTVNHVSDYVVEFPADITSNCEQDQPDFGEPEVFFESCELVAVSYEDAYFDVVVDACYKVVREWTVINWCVIGEDIDQEHEEEPESELCLPFPACDLDGDGDCDDRTFRDSWSCGVYPAEADASTQFGPDSDPDFNPWDGFITYQQVIKVIDTTAPEITCEAEVEICIFEGCSGEVEIPQATADDCSDDISIIAESDLGSGYSFSNVVPGVYTVVQTAFDNCGNSNSCTTTVTVVDCKNPTPYCIEGLIIELMNTEPPMVDVWAVDFDAGSFDNCPDGIELAFDENGTQSLVFGCDQVGTQAIQLWVTDAAGNQDFCETTVEIQDNMQGCMETLQVGGLIETVEGDGVGQVNISLSGNTTPIVTGADGMYEFTGLIPGDDYSIVPYKDIEPLNGVTTFDIVLIGKHVLNIDHLDSPYQLIAADANNSGSVTTLDLVEIRRLILHINDEFTNNNSWRFVSKDFEFADPTNPWSESFPEVLNFNNLDSDALATDFYGIKIGDVNGTANANNLLGTDDRNFEGELLFKLEDKLLRKGEQVTVTFTSDQILELSGYQFGLQFDKAALEFINLESSDYVNEENFGFSLLDQGIITTSWHTLNELNISEHDDLRVFGLTFNVLVDAQLSDLLSINSSYTIAEAYNKNSEILDVDLQFHENGNIFAVKGLNLYQNKPNPFAATTTIGFVLPKAGHVTLTIYDSTGKSIFAVDGHYEKGYNEVQLNQKDLHATGVLYYRLETNGQTATRKMIVLK